jgi:phage/plasmid-associated DNA primase
VKLVRKKIGRKLKGLLCYGDGNNGKDTLRAALAAVFGRGMTGKTLSDFRDYDKGRKFNIAGIEEALCNWSSENASTVKLDSLQSLKQFITGDPLDIERKGKDSFQCHPSAIFLANCNKLPSITGGMEAITSRYSILKFEKTFVVGADPSKGELEADPRFKDDPDFIRDRIAPALLNKLLERLPLVLTEGIDHSVNLDMKSLHRANLDILDMKSLLFPKFAIYSLNLLQRNGKNWWNCLVNHNHDRNSWRHQQNRMAGDRQTILYKITPRCQNSKQSAVRMWGISK